MLGRVCIVCLAFSMYSVTMMSDNTDGDKTPFNELTENVTIAPQTQKLSYPQYLRKYSLRACDVFYLQWTPGASATSAFSAIRHYPSFRLIDLVEKLVIKCIGSLKLETENVENMKYKDQQDFSEH